MSIYKQLFTDLNVLYKNYLKAIASSLWKEVTQSFHRYFLFKLLKLKTALENKTYSTGRENTFITYERGKQRRISSISIPDRIVMHIMTDEIYTPKIMNKIIYDNGASVPGKGIAFSRQRFETHLHKYYQRHKTNKGWILFGDFSEFYKRIDPDIAKEQLLELVDHDPYMDYLETEIFNSFESGISIGNQHSQSIGIYYPHKIDNYIKIVRGQKYYGRYMDDWYIISDSKEELLDLLEGIKQQCDKLKIVLHPKKTRIVPLTSQFTYLQVRYRLTETGKLIRRINPKRVTTMRRKLKVLKVKVDNGELPRLYVESMFKSWMGSFYKLLSRQQRINMLELYESLFNAHIEIIRNKLAITYDCEIRNA